MTKEFKRKEYTNVEAFVFGEDKLPDWFIDWFIDLVVKDKIKVERLGLGKTKLEFETKNGTSWGKTGDYIVKNGQGCVYPVLHDVFLELYEEVE